MKRDSLKG